MHNFDTMYLKYIFFVFFPMVIGFSEAKADLPLPMSGFDRSGIGNNLLDTLTET